jgi:hypothetical protein
MVAPTSWPPLQERSYWRAIGKFDQPLQRDEAQDGDARQIMRAPAAFRRR